MAHSPHRSPSGKGVASDEKKLETTEEMVKFKVLTKRLLVVSKDDLQRELAKEKDKKT